VATELRHLAVRGGLRADRERLVAAMALPPPLIPPVDAHARLGGPYTAGRVIARAVAEATLRSDPQLARRHDIEIRALVPEMRAAVPVIREALAEAVPAAERTRIYPRLRTLRLAHGLADFIRDYLTLIRGSRVPCSLVIENLEHADPSDRELVAVLVRRFDAALVTVVACEGAGALRGSATVGCAELAPSAAGSGDPLGPALAAHAMPVRVSERDPDASEPDPDASERYPDAGQRDPDAGQRDPDAGQRDPDAGQRDPDAADGRKRTRRRGVDDEPLAARYVYGDGVSDEPALLDAYTRLSPAARADLHDARADELARTGGLTARLGAIPYHAERGSDAARAGVRALAQAAQRCFAAGFHHAVTDFCARGRALASAERDPVHWWLFTSLASSSLAALGRGVAAERLYDEARGASTDPVIHRTAAYETAMLYARHHDKNHRDPRRALMWINEAIALAGLLPDPAERAFSVAFSTNGRALIEMRLGRARQALTLVDNGLALLDRDLPPDSHQLDRCSLLANRARLLATGGRLTEALAAQEALIALDSSYGEYHFELGNLLHLLGRDDAALTSYAEAQRLSLPFPELHYNRADLLAARGDDDGALAELDRVLELDPDFLDAYVNRAGILSARGDTSTAWADVRAGLARDPDNPYLLCVLGQLEVARGRQAPARAAFDAAIAASPELPQTWACRASLELQSGDPDAAVADLTQALERGENASFLFNRAVAHRAADRLDAAMTDAERALELAPGDAEARALLTEITSSM